MHDSEWAVRGQTNPARKEAPEQASGRRCCRQQGSGIAQKRRGETAEWADLLGGKLRRAAPAEGPEPPDLFSPLSAGQGKKLYAALSLFRINS